MRTKLTLREVTPEEREALEQLAHSRTAQARLVARRLGITRPGVYSWVRRFNERGLPGLQDRPRRGRPATYTPQQKAEVIAASLTRPDELGLPFGCWTLDRLQAYLNEHKGIAIKRSRIDEVLRAEGLRWRKQETWFGERVDPDFAEKRGYSSASTRSRRKGRSSSASTGWGRSRPRASPARR